MKSIVTLIFFIYIFISKVYADTLELLRNSCELEDTSACIEFAKEVLNKKLSNKYLEAEKAINKSCELNDPEGCYSAFYASVNNLFGTTPEKENIYFLGGICHRSKYTKNLILEQPITCILICS